MSEAPPPAGSATEPSHGTPEGPPPAAVAPPRAIRAAVILMWVGAASTLLGMAGLFARYDEMREEFRRVEPSYSASEVDSAVSGALTFFGLIGVVGMGLWMWMAFANGQGRSWARTVATVLGSLNVLAALIRTTVTPQTTLSLALTILGVALAVAILVLLYRPESSAYYAYKGYLGP